MNHACQHSRHAQCCFTKFTELWISLKSFVGGYGDAIKTCAQYLFLSSPLPIYKSKLKYECEQTAVYF